MKNLKVFSLAIAMLISFLSFGQESTITGVVSDNLGPLPGANVIVKSTNKGVQTDVDGKYSIKAKAGDILIFQFTGYETKNVTVGKSKVINVKLVENVQKIDEVVVTSFGRKKEVKRLAYSSQKVSASELYNSPTPNYPKPSVAGIQVKSDAKGIKISGNRTDVINDESYDNFIENPFESPKTAPLSTFSIDVDNASYTNVRRFINNGQIVPKDAVRVEEMINFFKYNYPQPLRENPFSINTEYSDCPWNLNNKLVRIGLQGKIIETNNLPASNMVFLIDVSGSMSDMNKLPLLKESLKILDYYFVFFF